MEFLIKSIEPKSKYVVNKYYKAITGRECDVLHLMNGTGAILRVDVPYDSSHPHKFYTTPVVSKRFEDNGAIVFETENSVYTLVPMKKEV